MQHQKLRLLARKARDHSGEEAKQIGQTWAAQATTRTSTTPTARATTKVAAAITAVARELEATAVAT